MSRIVVGPWNVVAMAWVGAAAALTVGCVDARIVDCARTPDAAVCVADTAARDASTLTDVEVVEDGRDGGELDARDATPLRDAERSEMTDGPGDAAEPRDVGADTAALDAGDASQPDAGPECALLSPLGASYAGHAETNDLPRAPPFTYEAWVWLEDVGLRAHTVLVWWRDDTGGIELVVERDALTCRIRGGSPARTSNVSVPLATLDPPLRKQEWTHVACQLDATETARLFLRGQNIATAGSVAFSSPAAEFGVANWRPGWTWLYPYVGLVDEVRVSTSARYSGSFVPERNPIMDGDTRALWTFDECGMAVARNAADRTRLPLGLACGASIASIDVAMPPGIDPTLVPCSASCAPANGCIGNTCGVWRGIEGPHGEIEMQLRLLQGDLVLPITYHPPAGTESGDAFCARVAVGSTCVAMLDPGGTTLHCGCDTIDSFRTALCGFPP